MRKFLFVDDNRALGENLAEIVSDQGDTATVAASGAEALDLARASQFDALVTDMRMPVMNGAKLVHEIRRIDPGLPAVVITAYTGDADLEDARREGLLAILQKPVPVERLLRLLKQARRNALVVLIEDDEALADNLTEALSERGFTAVTADSVSETDRLGGVRPFAAIVDLRVPGGPDGEAMRRLAARFPALSMIVTTAHDIDAPLACAHLFRKPFDTPALLQQVEQLWVAPK